MAIESVPESYLSEMPMEEQILKEMADDLGPNRLEAEGFLQSPVGNTEERGFQAWCRTCAAWTGHLYLPTKRWVGGRCMRCGEKSFEKVVVSVDPVTLKPLTLPSNLSWRFSLRYLCAVFGMPYVARTVEFMVRRRAKEIVRDELAKRLGKKREERQTLQDMGAL